MNCLVIDIGGSGCRVLLTRFDGDRITVHTVHQFDLPYLKTETGLYVEETHLFQQLREGLYKGAAESAGSINTIAVDTMGTSFALLDDEDTIIEHIISGRVPQEQEILESVFSRIPAREGYGVTGLQPKKLNSLFLLTKFQRQRPDLLEKTATFLMFPDLINFWLTGIKVSELTEAGTSWLLDIEAKTWSSDLIRRMDLNPSWFTSIVKPGIDLGPLRRALVPHSNLKESRVIAGASHDTASAFATVQYQDTGGWILSCGTWSILGSIEKGPVLTEQAFQGNYANEPAYDDSTMFVQNSVNLWIWEEFRRQLEDQGFNYTHEELNRIADKADAGIAVIDPMGPEFLLSKDIIDSISKYCEESGQQVPANHGEAARIILESLVGNYRQQFETHAEIKKATPSLLYLIGGGSRNPLLCQWTANALKTTVKAGPANATALGSSLIQLTALGEIGTGDFNDVVGASCAADIYIPV